MKNRSEAILIRRTGGKVLELKIIPQGKQGKTNFATDNVVRGSMDTVSLEKSESFIQWVDSAGRLAELEELVKTILRA